MTQLLTQISVRGENDFDRAIVAASGVPLRAASIRTLQVNIGLRCNLACHHCHVESGPKRTEEMSWETMEMVLDAAQRAGAEMIDITGGAPEMHPHFRRFVIAARDQGHNVIVRTNLTIMLEPGYEDLPEFFREQRVHLIASLPCYLETNVDKQRGKHVYVESIEVIKRLNAVGFGIESHLPLDLVYNPGGPSLPPPQEQLETDYRRELDARFGIRFTRLLTITNMPIGRFQHDLDRGGKGDAYRQRLRDAFNPATIEPLMCRHQVHVSHDGRLHDCDFNYALGMRTNRPSPRHISEFDVDALRTRAIATGEHCFGCTAGCGSSCGGALT
ncbi:MAG: arsenosugar biosynthesis radical SAM protein ArsS [Phycisphaerales bacterium]|nr:arsenosugar biosynthesis radical SAM protein ArsS [Phycisphaerales bacterium]